MAVKASRVPKAAPALLFLLPRRRSPCPFPKIFLAINALCPRDLDGSASASTGRPRPGRLEESNAGQMLVRGLLSLLLSDAAGQVGARRSGAPHPL